MYLTNEPEPRDQGAGATEESDVRETLPGVESST
jgi:hypothetical protein